MNEYQTIQFVLKVFILAAFIWGLTAFIRGRIINRRELNAARKRSIEESQSAQGYYRESYRRQAERAAEKAIEIAKAEAEARKHAQDRADAEARQREQEREKFREQERQRAEYERKRGKARAEEHARRDSETKMASETSIRLAVETLGLELDGLTYDQARAKYLHFVKFFAADSGGSNRLQQQINDAWKVLKANRGWK